MNQKSNFYVEALLHLLNNLCVCLRLSVAVIRQPLQSDRILLDLRLTADRRGGNSAGRFRGRIAGAGVRSASGGHTCHHRTNQCKGNCFHVLLHDTNSFLSITVKNSRLASASSAYFSILPNFHRIARAFRLIDPAVPQGHCTNQAWDTGIAVDPLLSFPAAPPPIFSKSAAAATASPDLSKCHPLTAPIMTPLVKYF